MSIFLLIFSAIILLFLDSIYQQFARPLWQWQVKEVQKTPLEEKIMGPIICNILLIIGINYFIINPKKSVQDAFLLGVVIYGVFGSSSYGLFKNWTMNLPIIDTLWGGTLFALTTWIVNKLRTVL